MRRIKSRCILLTILLALCSCAFALDPWLSISQYAHTAWTSRDGFSAGNIFSMAQTPDGYFWLGGEFGLFRFDGVRAVLWQPPAGQELPEKFAFQLVGAPDGTLWMGTFSGLASWDGIKLTRHPEFAERFVQSLFADHEGTVWAATRGGVGSYTRLCAMRRGSSQCFGDDGSLGKTVWTISEDRSGVLRIGTDSGIWRWKPGPPQRETAEPRDVSGLAEMEDGHIIASTFGADSCNWRAGWARIRCLIRCGRRLVGRGRLPAASSTPTRYSGIAMVVCGLEPWNMGSYICITAAPMSLRSHTGFLATSSIVCSKIGKAMSGCPRPEGSIAFVSSR